MTRWKTLIGVLLLVMVTLCAGNAAAAEIYGRLTNSGGSGIAGVAVTVYGQGLATINSTRTDATGNYRIGGLPADSYQIQFDTGNNGYASAWYGSSCPGAVLADSTVFNASMVLDSLSGTGTIQGRVTDTTGKGLGYIYPTAMKDYFDYAGSVATDANGYYTLNLPAGWYTLYFSAAAHNSMYGKAFISEYFDNVGADFLSAQRIKVTAGSISTASAVLEEGGAISGLVTDSYGTALSDIVVSLYDTNGGKLGEATTQYDGTYSFGSLLPRNYRVQFSLMSNTYPAYVKYGVWFNGATSQNAVSIAVTPGSNITGINAVIPRGSVAGRISTPDNAAVTNAEINLYDGSGKLQGSAYTDSNGAYLFDFVIPGTYKIQFGLQYGALTGWFSSKNSFAEATPVTVAEKAQARADLVLGKIGGKVTDSGGVPLAGISLAIYSSAIGQYMGTVSTDANGLYKSPPLFPGSYKLFCYAKTTPDNTMYPGQWYPAGTTIVQAGDVILPQATILTDVNMMLNAVPVGSVSGHVYDQNNLPVANARVSLVNQFGTTSTTVVADSNGYYKATVTSGGSYRVKFDSPSDSASNYLPSYYNGKSSLAGADSLSLAVPGELTNINGILPPGGIITGTARNYDGTPRTYGTVYLYDANYNQLSSTSLQPDGTYRYAKLPSGQYFVKLSYYYNEANAQIWFNGKDSSASANAIPVNAPLTTSGVDFTLPNGRISGTASYMAGCPPTVQTLNLSKVCAYDAASAALKGCVQTGTDGSYVLDGLASGSYKVHFVSDMENIPSRWYGGGYDSTGAALVTVQSPNESTGVDLLLSEGGTGQIVVGYWDVDGNPVDGAYSLYDAGGADVTDQTYLPVGNYRIKAGLYSASISLYAYSGSTALYNANFWYDGQADFASATPVPITAGTTASVVLTYQKRDLSYYYLTATQTAGGAMTPTSKVVRYGQNVTYSFVPDSGYEIRDVKVDDVSVGAVTSYTFSNISASHTISVAFAVKQTDTSAPVISSFIVPQQTQSNVIPVTALNGSDNTAITGWLITESSSPPALGDPNWKASPPASYTSGTASGLVTLYAWARDAAGNISASAKAQVTIASLPAFTVSVSLSGTGSGAVNSNPAGIACTSGTCTGAFDGNATVTLLSTPAAGSIFNGWLGDCSGIGDCSLTMTGTKAVTATFDQIPLVKAGTATMRYYADLAAAYSAAPDAGSFTIQAQAFEFAGDLLLGRNVAVSFSGGYDNLFSARSGASTVRGTLTIGGGSLTVDNLVIR